MKNYNKDAAASTNSALISAAARSVKKIRAVNTSAAAVYVKIYDKATAPTVGTDVPVLNITVPAKGSVNLEFKDSMFVLTSGLGIGITGAKIYTDTTAVGLNDANVNILWN